MTKQLRVVNGERLDYTPLKQNCLSCEMKQGKVCLAHNAYLQTNGARPNDCTRYIPRKIYEVV